MRVDDASAAQVRRLVAEVEKDRETFARRTVEARRYAAAEPEDAEVAALALTLDRSYTVLEAILERVARTLEGGAPVGEDWHRTLLENAGLDIEQVRPAILSAAAVRAAGELRRFRHFLRHAYAVDLDARRVVQLASGWLAASTEMEASLDGFVAFLQRLASELEGG